MLFEKMRLHGVNRRAYTFHVAGKQPAIRFGDLNCSEAQQSRAVTRLAAFVFASACARLQWAGLGGETFGSAGSLGRRFANPAQRPLTPFGDGVRVNQPVRGGRILLRHIPARPEQPPSPIELANSALRAAALAPTYIDALDVLADALLVMAGATTKAPSEFRRLHDDKHYESGGA
ncbi:hypothetical protein ACFPTO_05905 [Paraburkholderia denitrificans]|uniref:Uncharacterized protein n=1 Tax=Paraburkholderia denitrificans TaxID=694025 RepID=A0ABW0J5K0_9BURK